MIGATLSQFKITAKLGEGGMGEVYRAEDTKLGREVAIKVLPEAFTEDPERFARFEREAHVLASLNHPNIAAIYDLAEDQGTHFLVLELVEGQDLAETLAHGRMRADEALPLAIQMAEALEAAHEKGIVHRDLKPANVMIGPQGQVKILDFGLAKAWGAPGGDSNLTQSPTLTAQMTQAGVILGTAGYMSPEQARGQEADRRSDIWSFAVVLYEMLTGSRGFRGDTVSDTLASILKEDLDLNALPSDIPRQVLRVLQRCLDKNPKERLHSIADARLELRDALEAPVSVGSAAEEAPRSALLGWSGLFAAAVIGALLTFAALQLIRSPNAKYPRGVIHASILLPPEISWVGQPEISSDGSLVLFVGDAGGSTRIYARRLDSVETREIPGTEGAYGPFLSPDGRSVGFFADEKLKKVDLSGGDILTLADVPTTSPSKALWLSDGRILFTPRWTEAGLYEIPSSGGGEPRVLTELDRDAGELGHWWPRSLPGERVVLFTVWRAKGGLNHSKVAALNLETGEKTVLFDGASARYLATGHVLYFHAGRWLVVPFDPDQLERIGEAVPVLANAGRLPSRGTREDQVSVAGNGTVVYRPEAAPRRISWLDSAGEETPWPFDARQFTMFRDMNSRRGEIDLSPDGQRLTATVQEGGGLQIWIFDPELGVEERFVAGEGSYFGPVWHPDAGRIAFTGLESGNFDVLSKGLGASTPEVLVATDRDEEPSGWSSDGRFLIYELYDANGIRQVWMIDSASPGEPVALTSGSFSSFAATLSPDDRWLAYTSAESGRFEVYVQRFPSGASRIRVSRAGGGGARWSADGSTLYYASAGGLYSASLSRQAERVVVEEIRHVLTPPAGWTDYDVGLDGRIVAVVPVHETRPELRLITNWTRQLNELAPRQR